MRSQIIESVNIAEAKETIAQSASIYFSRDNKGRYRIDRRHARPICLMGPAGIGKTEIVRQVAEEKGLAFLSYSITHHTRQSIIGLPRLIEGTVDGRTVSMTEYTMSEIIAQIHRTMDETGLREGILFLDEFNCASESLRPIMLQLLQDKSFGPHPIPDGWMLVLAGNPPEYNRAASALDPVTADRMRMIHLEPDYTVWRRYAAKKQLHPMVLSYLDNNRDHFYVFRRENNGTALVTARGWEDLARMLTQLEAADIRPDLALVAQYIQAADIARSFFSYCTQYAALLQSGLVEKVLEGAPQAIPALQKLSFERGWSLISALLHTIQARASDVIVLDQTLTAVHEKLKTLSSAMAEDPTILPALDEHLLAAAENTDDHAAARFLSDCAVDTAGSNEGWEVVRMRFALDLRTPRMNAYSDLERAISNLLAVCRKAFEGQPHLEFLFNGISDSPDLLYILSQGNFPQFRDLFKDVWFDNAASLTRLEAQLDLPNTPVKEV